MDSPYYHTLMYNIPIFSPSPPPNPIVIVGEARDFGPRIVGTESLVPLKDASAETVSEHVRDLNFVLRLEIFVHSDGQLRASHLILGCNPV